MEHLTLIGVLTLVVDFVVRAVLAVRVIMRRYPVGVAWAWLAIILSFPLVGTAVYLLLGELKLGGRRVRYANSIHGPYVQWLRRLCDRSHVDWSKEATGCQPVADLVQASVGIPPLADNAIELLGNAEAAFPAMIADIDAAQSTCHLESYIWDAGGMADEMVEALARAAGRGVVCRVLLDAVGSHPFLRSKGTRRLREAGVLVVAALPAGLLRSFFVRADLRLHRKLLIIDGRIAYAGSLNVADPRFFKRSAGVGQWVDAMARLRGPAVEPLAITFLEDWQLETGEDPAQLPGAGDAQPQPACGTSTIQVVPSGPLLNPYAIKQILLAAIYSARRELILTTPYFIPDESLLTAFTSAVGRGVAVTLIVPEKVDSHLVRLASLAHQGDLATAGIRVELFRGGLLHTKSITIDGQTSLFGSVNLDPRSFCLDFEISLVIYDRTFTGQLRALQRSYVDRSIPLDLTAWLKRSFRQRLLENAARLVGPLL